MKILVTGMAGFIGFHVAKKLTVLGHSVVGIDNINDYYDPQLKIARLAQLGFTVTEDQTSQNLNVSKSYGEQLRFMRLDLEDHKFLNKLFKEEKFEIVCHFAAQAGVRYSIENPQAYIQSNIIGFFNILEACRHFQIKHLVYASSSSVYGSNTEIPFKVEHHVDHPISLYAATKKSNELMAHTYSHLYQFATTGLRFFTVYGPWGRPDMAIFLFTDAIVNDKPIKVFNHGNMERDFTYIDDIVTGVVHILEEDTSGRAKNNSLYKLYNIGRNKSVKLEEFIKEIEKNLQKEAVKEYLPLQPGDVEKTWANVDTLMDDYDYSPKTNMDKGVKHFIEWYLSYYSKV